MQANDLNSRAEGMRDGFWRSVRRAATQIPFMDEVVASYFCARDDKTPAKVRAVLLVALAYFVLPTDAIPDFLLAVGFTDDLAVLTAAIATVRPHITEAHREAARKALAP